MCHTTQITLWIVIVTWPAHHRCLEWARESRARFKKGDDTVDGEARNDKAVGGQGNSGAPRNGNSQKDAGDTLKAEITDELFAILFAF
ncbi:MAG: hypothetical protein NT013_11880 [Planctomycetia bacterium]|nr:hypothetical protein [Planctomycetia bacterium]